MKKQNLSKMGDNAIGNLLSIWKELLRVVPSSTLRERTVGHLVMQLFVMAAASISCRQRKRNWAAFVIARSVVEIEFAVGVLVRQREAINKMRSEVRDTLRNLRIVNRKYGREISKGRARDDFLTIWHLALDKANTALETARKRRRKGILRYRLADQARDAGLAGEYVQTYRFLLLATHPGIIPLGIALFPDTVRQSLDSIPFIIARSIARMLLVLWENLPSRLRTGNRSIGDKLTAEADCILQAEIKLYE